MSEEGAEAAGQVPEVPVVDEAIEDSTQPTETQETTEEPTEIEVGTDEAEIHGDSTMQDDTLATETEEAAEEQTEQAADEDLKEEEEEDDDDDFGDFSDASFDDFEEPQPAPETSLASDPVITTDGESSFPQDLFQDPEKLNEKLAALCYEAFPRDLDTFEIPGDTSILNERSTHLLERLVAQPYLKPYNWQRGSLRRQLLVTLGLPDDTVVHKERSNEFDMESYVVRTLEQLHIGEDEKKQLMQRTEEELQELRAAVVGEEELSAMSDEQLEETVKKLEAEVGRAEKLVGVWEHEKERLEEDHRTYESVVENLVGHTQRLRREEALKSLKKEKKEGRLGLFKLKKKS